MFNYPDKCALTCSLSTAFKKANVLAAVVSNLTCLNFGWPCSSFKPQELDTHGLFYRLWCNIGVFKLLSSKFMILFLLKKVDYYYLVPSFSMTTIQTTILQHRATLVQSIMYVYASKHKASYLCLIPGFHISRFFSYCDIFTYFSHLELRIWAFLRLLGFNHIETIINWAMLICPTMTLTLDLEINAVLVLETNLILTIETIVILILEMTI